MSYFEPAAPSSTYLKIFEMRSTSAEGQKQFNPEQTSR
jgi:hypothetical protein